ncbi:helix-turn-helix domain-containing protein [Streptomyces parvulus]|uniref:helix-turn-helix domain-containing protein n=1 Tax=Streptomyces parvulus TaxID=146923 RepID=UPI0034200CBE
MVQAYRFALDPNAGQEQALRSHCGAARAAYNWAVSWVTASWSQRKAEASYGIAEDELTPWRSWSLPLMRKEFNRVKATDPSLTAPAGQDPHPRIHHQALGPDSDRQSAHPVGHRPV